jgi:hypothetical protein
VTAPDEHARRALIDVWGWLLNTDGTWMSAPRPLEAYETEQLRLMAESLERAAAAVRRHIVRRGE